MGTKRIKLSELKNIISESIGRVLREGDYDFLDNDEFKWGKNGYSAYVLVDDSDDSVVDTYTASNGYDAREEAINDAKQKAHETRGGSFSVFGCENGMYDDNTLVFCTSEDRNSWKF